MNSFQRLNQYRCMWLLVFFDLPTETKAERKAAGLFRKRLLKDGFNMFQYSIYLRHCPSRENSAVHRQRTKDNLPNKGHVGILEVTDKQFGMMELYHGKKEGKKDTGSQQLELF